MLIIGHRGAGGEAPENMLAGFAHAQRVGVAGVELDLHLSADNQLVVIHDDTVDRTTSGSGPVASFTAAQLRRLEVPTLAEVLTHVPDLRAYFLEIKEHSPEQYTTLCQLLVQTVAISGVADRVIAISFDAKALETMRATVPGIPRGFLGSYTDAEDIATAQSLGCVWAMANIDALTAVPAPAAAEAIAAIRAADLKLGIWTCNTELQLHHAIGFKADAVITDHPSFARAYLRARMGKRIEL
jgi:glycerophosphoryl diester phosphodiesterase